MNHEPIAYTPEPSKVHATPHVYLTSNWSHVECQWGYVTSWPERPDAWWWGLGPAWWPFGWSFGGWRYLVPFGRKRA